MTRHYESWEDDKRMKIITICLFPQQLKALDKITKIGYSHSRSELIRKILDQYLGDYYKSIKAMELLTPEQIKIMGE